MPAFTTPSGGGRSDWRPRAANRKESGYRIADFWIPEVPYTPTPETRADVIRATHKMLVATAAECFGPDPDRIADELTLPVWLVRVHLGLTPHDPAAKPFDGKKKTARDDLRLAVQKALGKGPVAGPELARRLGRSWWTVRSLLARHPGLFARQSGGRVNGKEVVLWRNL